MDTAKAKKAAELVNMRGFVMEMLKEYNNALSAWEGHPQANTTIRVHVRWLPQIITMAQADIDEIDEMIAKL